MSTFICLYGSAISLDYSSVKLSTHILKKKPAFMKEICVY